MTEANAQADLLRHLQDARDALLWKLEGLSEYDVRRPLTSTGTNLLGLVKHLTRVELGYLGDTFGRPFYDGERAPDWYRDDAEENADMWATPEETREEIVGLYRQAWRHADATVAALGLDAVGQVPWWPEGRRETTLHHVLVRVLADTQRHAGQADIVRELIDGSVGWLPGNDSLPQADREQWENHRRRVEEAARKAGGVG
ncbi:DinB family protein [Streptomyces thermospinosisporus]|uniref:DinB family protein n=1 Tax=Streptomyces thermospinosisporus TaxID=161482 RepID=A0ABP4JXQ6_9ACTN